MNGWTISVVSRPQIGKIAFIPIFARLRCRYSRRSCRKMSPNATVKYVLLLVFKHCLLHHGLIVFDAAVGLIQIKPGRRRLSAVACCSGNSTPVRLFPSQPYPFYSRSKIVLFIGSNQPNFILAESAPYAFVPSNSAIWRGSMWPSAQPTAARSAWRK